MQPESFELSEDIGKPTAKLGMMADELYPIFISRDVTQEDVIQASNKVNYYKGKIDSSRFSEVVNSCKSYWDSRRNRELDLSQDKEIIYMNNKSIEVVKSCVEALNKNTKAQDLLHPKVY